jgi:hypothetical protein
MRDLGWFERKNLVYENRWVGDKPENARSLAAELAGLKVDVIVAVGRLSTGFQPSFRGEFMSRKTD